MRKGAFKVLKARCNGWKEGFLDRVLRGLVNMDKKTMDGWGTSSPAGKRAEKKMVRRLRRREKYNLDWKEPGMRGHYNWEWLVTYISVDNWECVAIEDSYRSRELGIPSIFD